MPEKKITRNFHTMCSMCIHLFVRRGNVYWIFIFHFSENSIGSRFTKIISQYSRTNRLAFIFGMVVDKLMHISKNAYQMQCKRNWLFVFRSLSVSFRFCLQVILGDGWCTCVVIKSCSKMLSMPFSRYMLTLHTQSEKHTHIHWSMDDFFFDLENKVLNRFMLIMDFNNCLDFNNSNQSKYKIRQNCCNETHHLAIQNQIF